MGKPKQIIIGNGEYKKTLKIRFTSDQSKDEFLGRMSVEFDKDFTKHQPYYEKKMTQINGGLLM